MKNLALFTVIVSAMFLTGCVERELTINTAPEGGLVFLNDEEIGYSPVTVSFLWYGDYKVRITKDGYETLDTHKELKAPLHDYFPFDIFAEVLNPTKIVDRYQWSFDLEQYTQADRQELLDAAENMRAEAVFELE
jgi:hypothetical protein